MDDIQERTLLEAITSIDKTLKRLSERFCSPESVDVAEISREGLIEIIKALLWEYDGGGEGRTLWAGGTVKSREDYAEYMADHILKFIQNTPKPPQHSSPYPD